MNPDHNLGLGTWDHVLNLCKIITYYYNKVKKHVNRLNLT